MEDNLIKILREFSNIQPDAGFIKRGRLALSVLPPQKIANPVRRGVMEALESFKFAAAITFASLMLFLIMGGVSYVKFKNSPGILGSMQEQDLKDEAEFSIQLGEAKYFEQSAEQVAAALNKISEENGKDKADGDLLLNSFIL